MYAIRLRSALVRTRIVQNSDKLFFADPSLSSGVGLGE